MIKDCFGHVAVVGDQIAFSMGNAGAKPWEHGVVTKISAKTITFRGKAAGMFRQWDSETDLRRGEGCFVIDLSCRGKADWPGGTK